MNQNEYKDLSADFQKRKAGGVLGGATYRPIKSNLPLNAYQNYTNTQAKAQEESGVVSKFGTAALNGVKSWTRGLLGAAKAAIDYNIAEHQKNDPNYRPYGDFATGLSEKLQSGINSLEREEVKADSAAGQLAYDLTEGAVQLVGQYAVTAMTGGVGGAVYMGTTIAGDQYVNLRKDGVDAQRAAQAGLMNAPFQAMLERLGMNKLMAKLPAGTGLKQKLGEVVKRGFEEGFTEGLQEFPEQLTNIWAKDKNATAESMAKKWGENWEQNVKEAGYSALLGTILGGGATGLHIVTDSVRRNVGNRINEIKKEQLVADGERISNSQVNPEYAAAAIDANGQGETISVQAKDLQAFKQQTNGTKLAETLKVTEEEIDKAAELGQDIDISKGNFIAAMVEHKGLFEATKDGMYFGIDGDLSTNAQQVLKDLKINDVLTKELSQKLDTEINAIMDSAINAGMNKVHAENLRLIIESRALIANPDDPGAWLQKHKLRFNNAGKQPATKRGWTQKVWGKRGWKQNSEMIDKGQLRPQEDGSYIIDLFKNADASTAIHETGHYFVDTLINEAALDPANIRLNNDARILLEYGGITMEQWQKASIDEKRAAHEKLAEGFESYIMEGKAPNAGLRRAFQRFAKWLSTIYSKIARSQNAVEINDNVRGVFDRMLASQEEIEVAAKLNGMFGELPPELTSKLSDNAKIALQDKIAKAKDKAVDILTKEMMKDFSARRKAEKAAYIAEIKPKIEELVHNDKVNQARESVGYWFGKRHNVKVINPEFTVDENGRAHANKATMTKDYPKFLDANPLIIARKYRRGLLRANYNDYYNDLKAQYGDMIDPIVKSLEDDIERYRLATAENTNTKVKGVAGHWEYRQESSVFSSYMDDAFSERGEVDPEYIKVQYAEDGKWTDKALERARTDGYVFVPASEGLGNFNWYARYVEKNGKRKPTKKELMSIAEDIYSGRDRYEIIATENTLMGIDGSQEQIDFFKERAKELADVTSQIKYLEKTPEAKAVIAESKKLQLDNEQRQLFEMIADQEGYSSGDEMAKDILEKPSEKQMVKNLVDEAVQKRFPDIYKERELAEQKAREALYNDQSSEVIALEHQLIEEYLSKAIGQEMSRSERDYRAKAMKKMAEVKAKEIISNTSVGDIIKGNGRRFALAERRAAANAKKAINKGMYDAALEYKRQQLVNHELYRQALEIKGKTESARRFIQKMARMKKENFGTEQHFNQIANLLERMGIARKGYNRAGDNQFLGAYVEEMRTRCGEIVDIPEFVLDERNDLSDAMGMTFAHYEDVVNALKNIYAIAKYDTRMGKLGKEQSFSETKEDILNNLRKLDDVYTPRLGGDEKKGKIARAIEFFKNYRNALRNADNFYLAMDNWTDGGYFTKNWYDNLNHCADKEAVMTLEFQDKQAKALAKWEPDKATAIEHDTRQFYEELGASADKHILVAMLCNLGNEGNMNRLCGTPPLDCENSTIWVKESELINKQQAIEMTRQNLVEFLSKTLTKADIEYAQARIDACNSYWPQIRDVNIRTKGFAPAAVEATPIAFKLQDGSTVMFNGGYFPLVRDSRLGSAPNSQNKLSTTDEYAGSNISTMRTDAASSKGRTGASYPVKLERGTEIRAITDTIHDICYRETMLDFRKILNDPEIFATLKRKLGETNMRLLREQLEECASPYNNQQAKQAEETLSKAADALRNVATNTAIMLNLKTALQNFSNIMLYGNAVDGFTHADAMRAMYRGFTGKGRADVDAICRKSVFMRERMETPDVALRDIKKRSDLNVIDRNTLKFGAQLLGFTDMLTAKPVFAEAYMKKINEGASEDEAIDFANRIIRRTLGSSRMQDVSSLQRGSKLFRLFTMFQGFFNTQFNQWDREFNIVQKLWGAGEKKEMADRLISFCAAKWIAACLLNVAIGELSLVAPFEKDKDGWRKISKELINYPLSMGGPIGQATNVALQNLLSMKNYGYRLTATQGLLDKGFTAVRRIGDVMDGSKKVSSLVEPLAYTVGAAYGVPGSVFNWVFNLSDILNGTMDAELADILRRRPKDERKPESELNNKQD